MENLCVMTPEFSVEDALRSDNDKVRQIAEKFNNRKFVQRISKINGTTYSQDWSGQVWIPPND